MDGKQNVISLAEYRAQRAPGATSYTMAVAFDRDSEDFVLGVETGLLMARLEARPGTWRGTYHTANRVMVERVANAMGYDVAIEPSESAEWSFADFVKR